MIFGKKPDLKNHLSVKRPTWAHKVVARGPHEQNSATEPQGEPTPENERTPKVERPESDQTRY